MTRKSNRELLADLGVNSSQREDISRLRYVRPFTERNSAMHIATRKPCGDFQQFKPLFDKVQEELDRGVRETRLLAKNAQINQCDWFILFGQKLYVAELSNERTHGYDKNDHRLRVIYDNGTESDLLLRSLQKALLYGDNTGRRIVCRSSDSLSDDVVL